MPDDLYWSLTPAELSALMRAIKEREEHLEKAAITRHGITASALLNLHRKKGAPPIKPTDFLKREKRVRKISPEKARELLSGWVTAHNRSKA